MFFRQILHEKNSCLSYLIGCKSCGVCSAIDVQGDPQTYLKILEKHGLKLTAIIETHIQADHISCAQKLGEITKIFVYFGKDAHVHFPHKQLADQDILTIGNRKIKILSTPGHTPEHICLYVDNWFLVSGDTLFVGDCGRVDLTPDSQNTLDTEKKTLELYSSLQKLILLPEWTEVYPGHYSGSRCGKGMDGKPVSTLGREKIKNKALLLSQKKFIEYITQNQPPPPENFQIIKRKNMGYES